MVHTAVVLTFYKRDDPEPPVKAQLWTPEAFEAELIAAFNDYDTLEVNEQLVSMYKHGISQTEPPSFGRFMPADWTEDTYIVHAKRDPNGKRKAVYDHEEGSSQYKRRAV